MAGSGLMRSLGKPLELPRRIGLDRYSKVSRVLASMKSGLKLGISVVLVQYGVVRAGAELMPPPMTSVSR